jgi:hypothetical protein
MPPRAQPRATILPTPPSLITHRHLYSAPSTPWDATSCRNA